MEENKRKKITKILLWCLLGLVLASIVAMSIAASVFKDKTDKLNKDNQQIEDTLGEE